MCTIKLNLPKAARRLYTMDGELITDMKQLLVPYYPELTYLKDGRHQVRGGFSSSFPVLSNFPENLVCVFALKFQEKSLPFYILWSIFLVITVFSHYFLRKVSLKSVFWLDFFCNCCCWKIYSPNLIFYLITRLWREIIENVSAVVSL